MAYHDYVIFMSDGAVQVSEILLAKLDDPSGYAARKQQQAAESKAAGISAQGLTLFHLWYFINSHHTTGQAWAQIEVS